MHDSQCDFCLCWTHFGFLALVSFGGLFSFIVISLLNYRSLSLLRQHAREIKFIFDQDLYMPGRVAINLSAAALETLHSQADAIFRGAISDTLHNAMEPEII